MGYPGEYYQRLFSYMIDNHNLILMVSEMQDLIDFIHKEYPKEEEVKTIRVEELESDDIEEKLVEEW